jgi:aminoglycoside phosphotransferase (APT) family kinase protein
MLDNLSIVRDVLSRAFPSEKAEVVSHHDMRLGRQQLTRIDVRHGGMPLSLVFRRYRYWGTWWSLDDHAKAEREATALAHARAAGLPVPRIFAHGDGWTLVEYVKGLRLPARAEHGGVHPVSVRSLAAAQAALHRLPPPVGPFPRPTTASTIGMMRRWAMAAGDARLAAAVRRLRPLPELSPVLVHGDLGLNNVIFHDDLTVAGLIDWEDSAVADPRFDLVRSYWGLLPQAPAMADALITAYEEATESEVAHLPQWLALICVRSWAWASVTRARGLTTNAFSTDEDLDAAERRLDEAGF